MIDGIVYLLGTLGLLFGLFLGAAALVWLFGIVFNPPSIRRTELDDEVDEILQRIEKKRRNING